MPTDAFHNCFGPLAGHFANQPVSCEMPFKSGPRQRNQSAALATEQTETMRAMVTNFVNFMSAHFTHARTGVNVASSACCVVGQATLL